MSRIGKQPVELPAGVKVAIANGVVNIEGPKGKLSQTVGHGVEVHQEGSELLVKKVVDDQQATANYGTTRALLRNMVHGVTNGWTKTLELSGVGYRASLAGKTLQLSVGLSYEVKVDLPEGIAGKVNNNTVIELESIDLQKLGNFAAKIRKIRPAEPYLGKGIKYAGEQIRRKAGKTGK